MLRRFQPLQGTVTDKSSAVTHCAAITNSTVATGVIIGAGLDRFMSFIPGLCTVLTDANNCTKSTLKDVDAKPAEFSGFNVMRTPASARFPKGLSTVSIGFDSLPAASTGALLVASLPLSQAPMSSLSDREAQE
jgi:hypothetical protein